MTRLLENGLLEKLGSLRFTGPRRVGSLRVGERRSMLRGASMEIADFRAYVQGDDFRYIDWNAMARFDQPVVRLFVDQRAMPVTIFLDLSASMKFGAPDKFRFALQLTAALGWIGLARQDEVTIRTVAGAGQGRDAGRTANFVAKRGFAGLHEFLLGLRPGGVADFGPQIKLLQRSPRGGITLVISDFLGVEQPLAGWLHLSAQGHEVRLLHVLSEQEMQPQISHAMRLLDAETGGQISVLPTRKVLQQYQQRLEDFLAALRTQSRQHHIPYALLTSDRSLEAALFDTLTSAAILQR